MTMQTVIGPSPMPKLATVCGTPSSRIRKLSFGILGMKLPLLSTTATSRFTVLTSLRKLGTFGDSRLPCWPNLDGILGCSASGAAGWPSFVVAGRRGLATVSVLSLFGPPW